MAACVVLLQDCPTNMVANRTYSISEMYFSNTSTADYTSLGFTYVM